MNFDVTVTGELFIDIILSGFDVWPQPGQEAFAKEFHREVGGAAITASGLARLGSRTALFGVLGSDAGEWFAERLRESGVVTSELLVDSGEPTAFSVAVSRPEDRTIFTFPGANRLFPAALAKAAFSGAFSQTRHVHLNCAPDLNTAADLLRAIRASGCTISLDIGWHEDWLGDPRVFGLLPLVDIFFPNEVEARRLTGEDDPEKSLGILAEAGAKCVALKLGARGAMVWNGEIVFEPARPVIPVDTVGAGDCFDAAFLHCWLRGESAAECLRAGNYYGGASTQAVGGLAGFLCEK